MSNNNMPKGQITDNQRKLLEGFLGETLSIKGVRNAVMAVESRDGTLCWSGAKGMASIDGTPMKRDTPFWIASVTKLFIAATILKLWEEGKLSIDDLAADHLPDGLLKGVHVINGVDCCNRITIRHLLSHSSGIPDYLEIKPKGEKTIIDRVIEGSDMEWGIKDVLDIVRKVNLPIFPPQDLKERKYRVRYSDTNFQILIAIIEGVTDKYIGDVFKDMLFMPLDLENTFLPGSKPIKPAGSPATPWVGEIPFDNKPLAMKSFGDLYSTTKDLIRFMWALIGGRVFSKGETLGLMTGMWQRFGFNLSPLSPGWPIEYSHGMMRFKMPKIFAPLSHLPELIGHTGATGSWLFYSPEQDLIFAGTINQVTAAATPFRILPKIANQLGKSFERKPQ